MPMKSRNPLDIFDRLTEGNRRFTTASPEHPGQDSATRRSLVGHQSPYAAVLGCSDSRVPVELVFDQGFGDFFTVRNAGHLLDTATLASLEFAVESLRVGVLLIMGHTSCGAVKAAVAAIEGADPLPGHLDYLPCAIAPHIRPEVTDGRIEDAPAAHVRATLSELRELSPIIAAAESSGKLHLAGAVYQLETGDVLPVDE